MTTLLNFTETQIYPVKYWPWYQEQECWLPIELLLKYRPKIPIDMHVAGRCLNRTTQLAVILHIITENNN